MAATVRATTKKAPAKKTTPRPAPAEPAVPASTTPGVPGFQPLRLTSEAPPEEDLVELFEVDGVMYSVPRKPRANIALQYLEALEQLGPQMANVYLLREMLGQEGYRALSTCKSLKGEHLAWVMETIHGLAMGTTEAPKA